MLTSDTFFITIHSSSLVVRILYPLEEIKPTEVIAQVGSLWTSNFGSWLVFIHSLSSSPITKWIDKEKTFGKRGCIYMWSLGIRLHCLSVVCHLFLELFVGSFTSLFYLKLIKVRLQTPTMNLRSNA